jgi:hypothetical protein
LFSGNYLCDCLGVDSSLIAPNNRSAFASPIENGALLSRWLQCTRKQRRIVRLKHKLKGVKNEDASHAGY